MKCPCGSNKVYLECCGLYIEKGKLPNTSLILMRSRYTAYTQKNFDYIEKTMKGEPLLRFNRADAEKNAQGTKWLALEILEYSEREVRFIATFERKGKVYKMEEKSLFEKQQESWFYIRALEHRFL